MSLTSTKRENNTVEMEIAVDAKTLKDATDRVFKRKAKNMNVPGFRKGKAPRSIIEKMYGEGIFLEDAVNDLFPIAYQEAVEEADFEPVDRADVEVLSVDKETGFTFKATVTAKPNVTISDYKGLAAEKVLYQADDASVDQEIENIRQRNARMVTVEDRAAEDGDTTMIDFEGFVDGVAFEGGRGESYQLVLGSNQFIEGFEEQIVGKKTGEEFDVNVTFPEAYHSEELQGKPAVFKVKLLELKAKELPALDDEFAKDVSEFDTLKELRDDIKTKQQEGFDRRSDDELENALALQAVEKMEADIPPCMYEKKMDEMARDFEYRLSSQGMPLDLYLQYTGLDKESFREQFREQAERQVQIRLALEQIAELEKFEITDDDVDAELAKLAEANGVDLEAVRAAVPKKDVVADLKCTRALDLIRQSAKVTEVAEADAAAEEADEKKPAKKPAKKTTKKAADKDDKESAADKAEKKPAKKPAAKKTAAKDDKKSDETEA